MKGLDACNTFVGALGENAYLNLTDDYVLREMVSLDDLKTLAEAFKRLLFDWAIEQMTHVTELRSDSGHLLIEAFRLYGHGASKKFDFSQAIVLLRSITVETWLSVGSTVPDVDTMHLYVSRMTLNEQIALIKSSLSNLETMSEVVIAKRETVYVYIDLWRALDQAKSVDQFFQTLIDRVRRGSDLDYYKQMRVRGAKQLGYSVIPDAFIIFLADRGVLLRPFHLKPYPTFARGLEMAALTEETRQVYKGLLKDFAIKFKHGATSASRRTLLDEEPRWERTFRLSFFTIFFCTTLRRDTQLNPALFAKYQETMPEGEQSYYGQFCRFYYDDLRARSLQKDSIPTNRIKKTSLLAERFAWVRLSYSVKTKHKFPSDLLSSYKPRQNIMDWGDFFIARLPTLKVKSVSNHISTISVFLQWLVLTDRQSSGVADLERDAINDGRPIEGSQCFRAFLHRRFTTIASINAHLSRLAGMFEDAIDETGTTTANPVIPRFDMSRIPISRGKTPRAALGADMLHYIRAFNAEGDFAFSRSRPAHKRYVVGDDGVSFGYHWYPGIALVIDFLLRIPVRGFQARYLDSGEGDEFLPDLDTPDLVMKPNPAATATKRRKEFVLTSIAGASGTTLLGLYINTNKTAVDRETGYEIPWCDEELKKNLRFMVQWQKTHNPLSKPIYCVEKGR